MPIDVQYCKSITFILNSDKFDLGSLALPIRQDGKKLVFRNSKRSGHSIPRTFLFRDHANSRFCDRARRHLHLFCTKEESVWAVICNELINVAAFNCSVHAKKVFKLNTFSKQKVVDLSFEVFNSSLYGYSMAFKTAEAERLSWNIKRLRKLRKINQATLAEASKLALGTIKQFETGKRWPRPENFHAMAKALDCDTSEFVQSINESPLALKSPSTAYDAHDEEVADKIASKVLTAIKDMPAAKLLSTIPPEIWAAWPKAPAEIKALCSYLLLEDVRFVDVLPEKKKTKVLAAVRALGLNLPSKKP